MHTLFAFATLLLGFAPFIIIGLSITTALWAVTKLLPKFGAWLDETFDRLMGVDEEYDRKYNTGYASNTFDQYV